MPDAELSNRQINEICDHFEDLWQAGQFPELEDFVVRGKSTPALKLFTGLLDLQLHYCLQQSWFPNRGRVLDAFPEFSTIIHEKFDGEIRNLDTQKRQKTIETLMDQKLLEAKQQGGKSLEEFANYFRPLIELKLAIESRSDELTDRFRQTLNAEIERTKSSISSAQVRSSVELIALISKTNIAHSPSQNVHESGQLETPAFSAIRPDIKLPFENANVAVFARALARISKTNSIVLRLRLLEKSSLPAMSAELKLNATQIGEATHAGLKELRHQLDQEFFALLQPKKNSIAESST